MILFAAGLCGGILLGFYLGQIAQPPRPTDKNDEEPLVPYHPPQERVHGIRAGVDPRDTR